MYLSVCVFVCVFVDCPNLTTSGLLHVSMLTKLENLTLHGVPAGVITDAGRDGPEDTGRWLQKLPESLRTLVISGELRWHINAIDLYERTETMVN